MGMSIGYLETTSSLSITADEDAFRLDVVRVREVVVRGTGDDAFLTDACSVVVDVGRLQRDAENDARRCAMFRYRSAVVDVSFLLVGGLSRALIAVAACDESRRSLPLLDNLIVRL